jgi:prepilin-type N-terminal cleavage/methylation domain-containing protein
MLKNNKGFSLIELMIAMVIGIFALTAILTLLTNNLSYGKQSIDMLKLNQEMRLSMDIMADDIRRAGYWNGTQTMVNNASISNPYSYPNFPVTINASNNCIVFSYDKDNSSDTPASDEKFGYALTNNTIVTGFPADKDGCNSIGTWNAISNPNMIKITALAFESIDPTNTTAGATQHQFTASSGDLLCVREIRIRISATLAKDDKVKQSLEKTIRLRNDEIRRSPAASCA